MVPKDTLHNRAKRASLHIDPTAFHGSDASTTPSPRASTTSQSPNTPLSSSRPSSSGSDFPDADEEKKAPSFGPTRSNSTASVAKSERERRKRSRVTPDQLVHLEQFFAVERSPTAARRREISDLLGMEERQTQVWFQNRRAKAKLMQTKREDRPRSMSAPEAPPQLAKGNQSDIVALLHEDAPVTIIPCTDLSVGTWRRIASSTTKHDLVAYICETKRILAWFVQSNDRGFKMEIPFDSVAECQFTNAGPGTALASFTLSRPPVFYLEAPTGNTHIWSQCPDWTEGFQGTHVLRHEIIGAAVQLAHLVQSLRERNHTSDIYLHPPVYADDRGSGPLPTVELPPPPPMHNMSLPESAYSHIKSETPRPRHSFSGRLPYGSHKPSHLSRSVSSISLSPPTYDTDQTYSGSGFGFAYSPIQYGGPDASSTQKKGMDFENSSGFSTPMASSLGPYFAQPSPRAFYKESPQFPEANYGHAASAIYDANHPTLPYHEASPPSPPILTTPFYPSSHVSGIYSKDSGALHPEMSGTHAPH